MVDIDRRIRLSLQGFVGLQGDFDAVANPVIVQYDPGGRQFCEGSFDVVNHGKRFSVTQNYRKFASKERNLS